MSQPNLPGTAPHAPAGRTETDALAEQLRKATTPQVVAVKRGTADEASVLLTPAGMSITPLRGILDAYLPRPVRRAGTTVLHDLPSFLAAVARARDEGTAIYVSGHSLKAVAIFDHDHAGPDGEATARWASHRAELAIGFSPAWQAWNRVHGESLSQTDFATFIEDHVVDIVDPMELDAEHPVLALANVLGVAPAARAEVVAASRGLRLRAEINVAESITLESGETELVFGEKHTDANGGPLRVPSAFVLGFPLFEGAIRDVMLVRLRYRRAQGAPRVHWTATIYQREEVRATAMRDLVRFIAEETGAPVFLGDPPPDRAGK